MARAKKQDPKTWSIKQVDSKAWLVKGQYHVRVRYLDDGQALWSCTCPHFHFRRNPDTDKHIAEVIRRYPVEVVTESTVTANGVPIGDWFVATLKRGHGGSWKGRRVYFKFITVDRVIVFGGLEAPSLIWSLSLDEAKRRLASFRMGIGRKGPIFREDRIAMEAAYNDALRPRRYRKWPTL